MNIVRLALYTWRNFTQVEEIILPPESLLIAAAPNATGKTNFLEALVVLLRGKSWRASHQECIQWGGDSFTIRGTVRRVAGESELAVQYHEPTRRLRVEEEGGPASPVKFYSDYPLILFLPEDTFIFSRGPAARRNFLNRTLVSRTHYVAALVQYQRVLKQRNMALKTAADWAAVDVWTNLLIERANVLWRYRVEFMAYLSAHLDNIYYQLSGEAVNFTVNLERGGDAEPLGEKLKRLFSHERRYGYTLAGPHRDDLVITIDNRLVTNVLSRGQQRSLVAALKVASWHYIHSVTGEKPLMLFDEVLSELDEERASRLINHLPQAQIIVTCTAVPASIRAHDSAHLLDLRSILTVAAKKGEAQPALA